MKYIIQYKCMGAYVLYIYIYTYIYIYILKYVLINFKNYNLIHSKYKKNVSTCIYIFLFLF